MPQDATNARSADEARARLERLRARAAALDEARVLERFDLEMWRAVPADAPAQEIAADEPWPTRTADIAFERPSVTVPARWPLADARVELETEAPLTAIVHSKHGRVAIEVAPGRTSLPAPALAYGLRLEATAEVAATAPRFGRARLVRVDPDVTARAARLTGLLAEAAELLESGRLEAAEARLGEAETVAADAPSSPA